MRNPFLRAALRSALATASLVVAFFAAGCGINKSRLATEQLVVSEAVDKAVAAIDFSLLSGKKVFFDTQYLDGANMGINGNVKYLVSSLRQQMMAYDLRLQEKADAADFVVEARVGVLANDGYEVTYGIPGGAAAASATVLLAVPVPTPQMPELSVGRRNHQAGSAKIGLFAYDRLTREPVWQAGVRKGSSDVRDTWFLGLGPYQSRPKRPQPWWRGSSARDSDGVAVDPLRAYNETTVFERAVRPANAPSPTPPEEARPFLFLPPMTASNNSVRSIDVTQRERRGPRVLIVRLSAVGDCIQTMPLACAVRDRLPDAHITWLVEPAAAPLVQVCDAVDRVFIIPKRLIRSPRHLLRLRRTLKQERFEAALDPQGLFKSGLLAWLSGAERRIGFAPPVAREGNHWFQTERIVSSAVHRVDRYLELAPPLGGDASRARFGIVLPAAAVQTANELVARLSVSSGFVVLNPGAGWDSKRWPSERYAVVARHLASRGWPSLVVWAGQRERAWAESIVEQAEGAAMLAPATSLLELAALLRRATLFVGSDTGPLHLAAAVDTPCVALFGASSAAACGPYGENHVSLQLALDNSSTRKKAGADNWAMRLIRADAVCDSCDRLLAASGKQMPRQAA